MLKIGFIGAGNYGINHIKNTASLDFAKVCAVATKKLENAVKVTNKYGGAAYDNVQEMLEKETLDACFISLPAFAHGEAEMLAIDKGMPICVDKPVSNTMHAALEIEKQLKNKGIINSVGYQWRYFDIVDKAKELIKNSQVIMCTSNWLSTLPGGMMPWWGKKEDSGGQIVEQATHMYDLARYLFGEPVSIQSVGNHNFPGNDTVDIDCASSVNMRFANGVIANMSCACALPVRYKCGFTIFTDREVVELVSVKSGMMNVILNIITKDGAQTIKPERDPVFDVDKTFLTAVKNNDPRDILCDYSEAVKTLKITIEASNSL